MIRDNVTISDRVLQSNKTRLVINIKKRAKAENNGVPKETRRPLKNRENKKITERKRRQFRSTSCGRWKDRTRRILAWRSTSVGRWREKPRWSHRSRPSISSREER